MKKKLRAPRHGIDYLLVGLRRLPEPGIRRHILIPLAINIGVFSTMIWFAIRQFSHLMDTMMGWLPEWLGFLAFLVWPLFAVTLMVGIFFTFTLVANFIAAPFNGLLAERIQRELNPDSVPDGGWTDLIKMIPQSITREIQRLAYYIPRALALVLLSFIPVVNLFTPILWFLFSAWMVGLQYSDYAADNERYNFKETKARLAQFRLQTMVFGGAISLLALVPVLNLVLMPAAVIGGSYLWIEKRSD